MERLTRPPAKLGQAWAVYVRRPSGRLERIVTTTPARTATSASGQVLAAAILPAIVTAPAVWPKVGR